MLVEIGILLGTGLAIWSDLFTKRRIIGLDIDPFNFNDNLEGLKAKGAFTSGILEVQQVYGFIDNREYLGEILNGDSVTVFIYDASHTTSVLMTFHSVQLSC